jgi:hypothetical protein
MAAQIRERVSFTGAISVRKRLTILSLEEIYGFQESILKSSK